MCKCVDIYIYIYIYILTFVCIGTQTIFPLPGYNCHGWQGVRSQFPFHLLVYDLRRGVRGGAFLCCTCSLMWFEFLSGFVCAGFLKPLGDIFTSKLYYSFSGTCGGWQSVVAFCTCSSLLCASACVCVWSVFVCARVFVLFCAYASGSTIRWCVWRHKRVPASSTNFWISLKTT